MRKVVTQPLIALFIALVLSACNTAGVTQEAQQLAQGVHKLDSAMLVLFDLSIAANIEFFEEENAIEMLSTDTCVGWVDASCESIRHIHSGGGCAIAYLPNPGRGACPDPSDPMFQSGTHRDLKTRREEFQAAHALIANTFDGIAQLTGAGSTRTINASVEGSIFSAKAVLQAGANAAKQELDAYTGNDQGVINSLTEKANAAEAAAQAQTAALELTESFLVDFFEWRLAKRRLEYARKALGEVLGNDGVTLSTLSESIASRVDLLIGMLHRDWQKQLSDDLDRLTTLDGPLLPTYTSDPDTWKKRPSPHKLSPAWKAWHEQYDHFRLTREIVLQFESMQEPSTGTYTLPELIGKYAPLARDLRRLAADLSKRPELAKRFYEFNESADAAFRALVRAREVLAQRGSEQQ